MQEIFEKIIEKLEERKQLHNRMVDYENKNGTVYEEFQQRKAVEVLNYAIEIVKQEAEKFGTDTNVWSNGWIPCSGRLPKLGEVVIITTKEGLVYSDIQYDYRYNGDKFPCFHRWDSEMWQCFQPDVIAWQPLPLPFRDKE